MAEQLLPPDHAQTLSEASSYYRSEQIAELTEVISLMSPQELAQTTVDFLAVVNRLHSRTRVSKELQQVAAALGACKDIALEQCVAARKIEDHAESQLYFTIFEAARFDYDLITDRNFFAVSIPRSCDEIYTIAKGEAV